MARANNRKSKVSGGQEILHKCAGTKSSKIGNNDFYYDKEEWSFHPFKNEQHGSPVLSNENWGHRKPRLVTISNEI